MLVSFFQPRLLEPGKPVPGVQIVGTKERKASRKKGLGVGREGEEPSSLPPPFFRIFFLRSTLRLYHYPLSEHLEQASVEKVLYPTKKRAQRAVEISEAV